MPPGEIYLHVKQMESPDRRALYSVFLISSILSLTGIYLVGLLQGLKDLFIMIMELIVEGGTALAGWFVISTIESMLFFPPPTQLDELTGLYWGVTFPLFWGLLSVVGAGFFLGMQLFPESEKSDPDKFMKRVLIAVVLLWAVGHGFGLGVEMVHAVASHLYPESFRIAIEFDTLEGIATASFTGFAVLVFAWWASPKIILTYAMFLIMLGMRMVIVYSTYVLFPILIAFWITDIGPFKYGKMMAGFMFKATIFLLLFGVLIAAILGVGGALAAADAPSAEDLGGEREDIVLNSDYDGDEDTRYEGGVYTQDDPQASAHGMSAVTSAWVSVYSYFAAIWLCITLTSMFLGVSVSTGLTKKMARAGKLQGGMKRIKSRLNNDGSKSGSGSGSGSGPSSPSGSGDGQGGGNKSDGAPEPDNPDTDDRWFGGTRDKLDQATDKLDDAADKYSDAKDKYSEKKQAAKDKTVGKAGDAADKASEKVGEGADKVAEKGSEAGDAAESGLTSAGEKAGSVAGAYGAAAGKGVGKAAGKVANAGITAAGYAPKAAMKGANLAKRGGQAYWNVFKEPDAVSSIGEAGRIARDSPIGHPEKGNGPGSEAGPEDLEDTETLEDFQDNDEEEEKSNDDDDDREDDEGGEETTGDENDEPPVAHGDDEDEEEKKKRERDAGSSGDGDSNNGGSTASPDDPVDSLYEESDPASRDNDQPAVNEDAAEAIAEDIDKSFDQPSENTVRDAVHDRVDQDLGDDIESMGAEHAVLDKYRDISGREDSMRSGGDDYKWS